MSSRTAIAAIVLSLAAAPLIARQAMTAKATFQGTGIAGTADLREIPTQLEGASDAKATVGTRAIEITISVTGLKPGPHGVHLHAVGRCEAPFTSAGGHFDPGPHGLMDPDTNHPFHMGDLPNLVADANGRATLKAITTRATLSAGPVSLMDADGTAIIIHENVDQGITGAEKSGVSGGPRIACGVVTKP